MEQNPYAPSSSAAVPRDDSETVVRLGKGDDPATIHSAGRLSNDEIRVGFKLALRGNLKRYYWMFAIAIAIIVAASEIFRGAFLNPSALVVLIVGGICFLSLLQTSNNQIKSTLNDPYGWWRYRECLYTAEHVDLLGPAYSGRFTWDAFSSWRARQDVIVLMVVGDGGAAIIVAKNQFASEHDWNRFHELLERKLPRL